MDFDQQGDQAIRPFGGVEGEVEQPALLLSDNRRNDQAVLNCQFGIEPKEIASIISHDNIVAFGGEGGQILVLGTLPY